MTKKILLIIGILVIVGLAVFLIFGSQPQNGNGENNGGFSIRNYLPFGNSVDLGTSGTTTSTTDNNMPNNQTPNVEESKPIPKLRKISKEPVAGSVIFNIGTTSVVRFIEKGTGNVYEAKSNSLDITRLTNTTIPKIIRAFWLPNASGFLAQTLLSESEVIETNFVKLNKNNASSTSENMTPFNTTKSKLPTGIKEISIKPDGTKIFYYTITGASNWFVSNPDGTASVFVMSHPLTEWLPKWISSNTIVLQSKASSESAGFVYSFDVLNKTLKKMGTEAVGLSVNPNESGLLSLISVGGNFPKLFVVDNKNISTTDLKASGLAEKCVWLKDKNPFVYCAIPKQIPSGNYPDIWYKGLVSTEDYITKIDLNNDIFTGITDLSSLSNEKIDVVDMNLSPNGDYLIFKNKTDGFLWMLRIGE